MLVTVAARIESHWHAKAMPSPLIRQDGQHQETGPVLLTKETSASAVPADEAIAASADGAAAAARANTLAAFAAVSPAKAAKFSGCKLPATPLSKVSAPAEAETITVLLSGRQSV